MFSQVSVHPHSPGGGVPPSSQLVSTPSQIRMGGKFPILLPDGEDPILPPDRGYPHPSSCPGVPQIPLPGLDGGTPIRPPLPRIRTGWALPPSEDRRQSSRASTCYLLCLLHSRRKTFLFC